MKEGAAAVWHKAPKGSTGFIVHAHTPILRMHPRLSN